MPLLNLRASGRIINLESYLDPSKLCQLQLPASNETWLSLSYCMVSISLPVSKLTRMLHCDLQALVEGPTPPTAPHREDNVGFNVTGDFGAPVKRFTLLGTPLHLL